VQLTQDSLVTYQGLNGMDGMCHVRVYAQAGRMPVVIVGQLEDNPGSIVDYAIEMIAATVQGMLFRDGREFQLVRYYPAGACYGGPRFSLVEFRHRSVSEDPSSPSHYTGELLAADDDGQVYEIARGEPKEGTFRDPSWTQLDNVEGLIGCAVEIWPEGEYTAARLFGEQGEQLRAQLAANARAQGKRFARMLREDR
jgi:hypothetical protein